MNLENETNEVMEYYIAPDENEQNIQWEYDMAIDDEITRLRKKYKKAKKKAKTSYGSKKKQKKKIRKLKEQIDALERKKDKCSYKTDLKIMNLTYLNKTLLMYVCLQDPRGREMLMKNMIDNGLKLPILSGGGSYDGE